jgi:hypothetical protein
MAQDTNRFVCEGCGKQFENRNDLQTHTQNCQALKASQRGSNPPKTKTAGGQGMPESQE